MGIRIHDPRKIAFVVLVVIFGVSLVVLSTLALQNNQAQNSRAANKAPQMAVPTAAPPSLEQQADQTIQYKASIDNANKIQFFGFAPPIKGYQLYTVYQQKPDKSFMHMDTFIATQDTINALFTDYWAPITPISPAEVKNSVFYLYRAN